MKKFKKTVATSIAFSILISSNFPVFAANPAGRNINIHSIEGNNASFDRGNGRSVALRSGQRLSAGNLITTGDQTSVFLRIDQNSIFQMYSGSQVAVASTGNNLSLTLQSGAALVEVESQALGNTMETRLGNTSMAVRGTMYTVQLSDNNVVVAMLTGLGYISGLYIPAGYAMIWDSYTDFDSANELVHLNDVPLELLHSLTIETILENREMLVNQGTISISRVTNFTTEIAERQTAQEAQRVAQQEAQQAVQQPVQQPPVSHPPAPQPPSQDSSDNQWNEPPVLRPPFQLPTPPGTGNESNDSNESNDNSNIDSNDTNEDSNENENYLYIYSDESWLYFSENIDEYMYHTVYLTSNINVTSSIEEFRGRLRGNNHTIDNTSNAPLFLSLYRVNIRDLSVTGDIEINIENIGILAGQASFSTIANVIVEGNITSDSAITVGGILGNVNNTSILNSTFNGDINSVNSSGNGVGGIVGSATSSNITNNNVEGTITANNFVGGVVGSSVTDVSARVDRNTFIGAIIATNYVGGIVGQAQNIQVTENEFEGTITATGDMVGPIYGFADNSNIEDNIYTFTNYYDTDSTETPGAGTPANGTPANGTPGAGTPANGTPGAGTPANGTPGAGTPANGTPGAGTPANGTPGAGTPSNGTPGAGTPSNGTPGAGTPSNGTPGAGTPDVETGMGDSEMVEAFGIESLGAIIHGGIIATNKRNLFI